MTDNEFYPQICMRRSLEDLPEINVPEGYTLRHYRPGDGEMWDNIINYAFSRDNMSFYKLMHLDYAYREERIFFICKDDVPVATASAWYRPEWGSDTGYLHMVGTHPDHAGKKLGYLVSLAAMHRMKDECRKEVILQTDDFRIPAIKTYLNLGFEPVPIHENHRIRWKRIFKKLNKPELTIKFKGCLESSLFDDIHPRKDLDSPDRYPISRKWHPDRPHRLGTGLTDALGDESLYKPQKLGTAELSPRKIKAASKAALKIRYTAGEAKLYPGSKVAFYTCGQGALFKATQISDKTLRIRTSAECELKPYIFGVEIIKGTLECGDTVELETNPFDWTPIADKYQVKVIIDKGSGEPQNRLPGPLTITVEPLETEKIDARVPCTYKPGETVTAKITARDRFDNRTEYKGLITITHGEISEEIYMHQGYAEAYFKFAEPVETLKGALNELKIESNPCILTDDLQLYVGDLHAHDFLSAASGWTDQAYSWARYDKALDFVSVPVQNHGWLDNEKWTIAKHLNERYLEEGEFVTFLACEWQHSGYSDKVVHFLNGDQPYFTTDDRRTNSAEKLYEAVRASDAFIISHHTAYKQNQWCGGADYDVMKNDVERLIELWSMHGSSEGFDNADRPMRDMDAGNTVKAALNRGLKLGFAAGSDTHCAHPGGSCKEPRPYWGGLTAVWAHDKTRRSIFNALFNRHTYALTDTGIVLRMTVNGALMGSEIKAVDTAKIKIEAHTPSEIEKIQIIKNTELLKEYTCNEKSCVIKYTDNSKSGDFYHSRIVLKDGNLAVGSPVWLI